MDERQLAFIEIERGRENRLAAEAARAGELAERLAVLRAALFGARLTVHVGGELERVVMALESLDPQGVGTPATLDTLARHVGLPRRTLQRRLA